MQWQMELQNLEQQGLFEIIVRSLHGVSKVSKDLLSCGVC